MSILRASAPNDSTLYDQAADDPERWLTMKHMLHHAEIRLLALVCSVVLVLAAVGFALFRAL